MRSRLTAVAITAVFAITMALIHRNADTSSEYTPVPRQAERFDVIIAGGSTAAFAAAVSAAECGARTCLIEPTDWIGGQLSASGVPAVDEAWHKFVDPASKTVLLDVAAIARSPENMTPNFQQMLAATGNPGHGWVSRFCFEPGVFLTRQLVPLEEKLERTGKLVVFRNTVIKSVEADPQSGLIHSLTAIQRTPRTGVSGYGQLPSQDLEDWYSPVSSPRFSKRMLTFAGPEGQPGVFIDATEWGEVLVLAGAPYLQGIDAGEGSPRGDEGCGQSCVFGFVERLNSAPIKEPAFRGSEDGYGFGQYAGKADAWSKIWTYRRIRGSGPQPAVGDLCLQNWGYSLERNEGGNDYPFGYLLLSRAKATAQRANWKGGIDLLVLAGAEQRALGWHEWFKKHPPPGITPGQVTLERRALGTGHGLSKLPYLRDTRRSIGLDGFILKSDSMTGPAQLITGTRFRDRIALGAYPIDIHPLVGCGYPVEINQGLPTLPFFIPFRAITNMQYGNLLVAGKTMAQSFLANSATRLHPIEWSTGTAAGVAAAYMARTGRNSREALEHIGELQSLIRVKTPIEWTIKGRVYPDPEEVPLE